MRRGGIAGAAEDAITIYKSVNHGNITINRNAKYYGAGGILGYVKQGGAHVRYCCNRANIDHPKDKEDSHGIGGIVGSIEKANDNDDSYVLDCYNMGEINGQQKATSTLWYRLSGRDRRKPSEATGDVTGPKTGAMSALETQVSDRQQE